MAKNDFSAEAPVNYEQKCLFVLVLDISSSMQGTPIAELNRGLQSFYKEVEGDPTASQRLEVSLITFNHIVTTVQEPALVENFKMPTLTVFGSTAMVDAVHEAIAKVAARKAWYKSEHQLYYRPWIILMTDGEPDSGQDVVGLASTIKADTAAKKYAFLPIGVEGANMAILNQIASSDIPAMSLKGTNFNAFFLWLSASAQTIINEEEGQTVTLADPSDWMNAFTI